MKFLSLILFSAAIASLSFDSCGSSNETSASTTNPEAAQPELPSPSEVQNETPAEAPAETPAPQQTVAAAPAQGKSRFVAAFYSKGEGIDLAVHDEFVSFLDKQPKKIAYEPQRWGREGEIVYCLALSELSPAEQKDFIAKAKKILSKSQLVHVKENIPCEYEHWSKQETAPAPAADPSAVRFVAAFYSKGEGIDLAVHDEFVSFLDKQPKKIAYEPQRWGREGETAYCLQLKELSAAEQKQFISKAKTILAKSKLVHVKENIPCEYEHWAK